MTAQGGWAGEGRRVSTRWQRSIWSNSHPPTLYVTPSAPVPQIIDLIQSGFQLELSVLLVLYFVCDCLIYMSVFLCPIRSGKKRKAAAKVLIILLSSHSAN